MRNEHLSLRKSHTSLLNRYELDLSKSESQIKLLVDQADHMQQEIDQLQHERAEAIARGKEEARESALMAERLRDFVRKSQRETDDLILKHREQIAKLQDTWALEREELLKETNQLKRSKVDLQVCRYFDSDR
jgi:hypothetical protein